MTIAMLREESAPLKPTAFVLTELPDIRVCGADVDRTRLLQATAATLPKARKSPSEKAKARFALRYFGETRGRDEQRTTSADAVIERFCVDQPNCRPCPLRYRCSHAETALTPTQGCATFADLFCGAGGLSLGFEQAGLLPKLALDSDYWSLFTYRYNRPSLSSYCDILHSDIEQWLHGSRLVASVDVLAGGVPCQPFSNANKQRQTQDPRESLFELFFQAVDQLRPRAVLIENVGGFKRVGHLVEDAFEHHGYASARLIVDACEFGVPQRRRRLFYIAIARTKYRDAAARASKAAIHVLSQRTHTRHTLRDAIADLPALEPLTVRNTPEHESNLTGRAMIWHSIAKASSYVKALNRSQDDITLYNHKARYNNERDIEIFSRMAQGDDSLSPAIADLMPYASRNHIFADKYFKLRYDEPSKTITAHMRWDCNSYIHPEQPRGLTAREAARAQGFPDDYVFTGTFQRLYQQVGNAVPPPLARILGGAILAYS